MADGANGVAHPAGAASGLRVVGTCPPRADAADKVTGQARYTGDLVLPGVLRGRILRSPYPHARIVRVDASAALAVPGVVAVLTGDDVLRLPKPLYGHAVRDRPVLATGRARFVGEPVAAVAADSDLAAEDALERIVVEYEPLPAVTDMDEALRDDAPRVHGAERDAGDFGALASAVQARADNVCHRSVESQGDVAAAFAGAAHVFAETYTFPSVYHYALEPFTVLAEWQADGVLHLWSSCQHPFVVRSELADVFGMDPSRVRLEVPYVGGGFGSKSYTNIEPLVAALARKAARPVKVELSVEEAFHTKRRHAARIDLETAWGPGGELRGARARIRIDTGAYADNGPRVAERVGQRLIGPYTIPAYHIETLAVYTHTLPAGSFRAIGAPQGVWAWESHLDEAAHRLGRDATELRLANLTPRGRSPLPGRKALDADVPGDLRLLTAAMAPGQGRAEGPVRRGSGLAVAASGAGAGPVSVALVRVHADGRATVHAGSTEIGQGARTVLAMICAEELALDPAEVRFIPTDSDATPFDRSTGSSRSTTVAGTAVQAAAQDAREQLRAIAAEQLEIAPGDLACERGGFLAPDGRRAGYADLLRFFFGMRGGEIVGRGYSGPRVPGNRVSTTPTFWELGMGAAEVEVDVETGILRVPRYVTLADVGRAVHPELVEGQELGALTQGLGHTCFEELCFAEGQPVNASLAEYRVPLAEDVPEVEAILVENGDGPGPYGVKGMGEGAIVPVAAAVGNALRRAAGIHITDCPLTPERVWRALRRQRAETAAAGAGTAVPSGGRETRP